MLLCVHNLIVCVHRVDSDLSVRVGDFGLARDIYQDDYYRQNSRIKIPVKWMAPESLHDGISNEKTDVVSSVYIMSNLLLKLFSNSYVHAHK